MAKKKILIVDDDEELGEELAELLESEGYQADKTLDGAGAKALIGSRAYDVFLLDYKMENITGLELLKAIKRRSPEAAVFFISGKPELQALVEAEGLAGSVAGVIEKPFSQEQLLEKLGGR